MKKIGVIEVLRSSGSLKIKAIKLIDLTLGSLIACLVREKKKGFEQIGQPRRILVIRPGGIGDAIFLIPILRVLKKSRQSLAVDILCEKRNQQVFLSQKDICDSIYCYDNFKSFFALFKNQYDIAIDTEQWHYLSALAAYLVKSKQTIGFATRPLRAKLFDCQIPYDINSYELFNFRKLFEGLFATSPEINDIDSCFQLSDEMLDWAYKKVPTKSVSLFLGASIPEKRFTKRQSLELIRLILERGFDVIMLGGRDVQKECKSIADEISDDRLVNFAGETTIEQSAALIKKSRVFVGPDSGLMHLACAVGTPVVAIFGSSNQKKWGPHREKYSIVSRQLTCSPCAWFGYCLPTCRGSYRCIQSINLRNICNRIEESVHKKT